MNHIGVGLQIYSVREAFAEDPVSTLKRVAGMGYEGAEFTLGMFKDNPETLKGTLADTGMACFGCLTGWNDVQSECIGKTIACNRAFGSPFIVIGSVPTQLVSTPEDVRNAVRRMREIQKIMEEEGFLTGYHNHASDFTNVVDGKPFFEHVFDNTPESFVMLLDTGNALAGGYESIPLLEKYPNRSPFLHIKGYSKEKEYLATIGEDDFDWPAVIRCAIETGAARTLSVEFGKRGDYDPFERAKTSLDRVRAYLG